MNNFVEKLEQQKSASLTDALNEKNIKPTDIAFELLPLINDYFIGKFKVKDNTLEMNFLNGQIMRLTVIET